MIRIVHFSDLHLGSDTWGKPNPQTGLNQRVHDFCDRLDELVEFAVSNDVDVVLFAGDAFKNARPDPTVQKLLAERIWRLAKSDIRIFLLAGNHDLPRMVSRVTAFSVYPALEVANVVVAEQPGIYPLETRRGETLQIAAMPHFWRSGFLAQIDRPGSPADIDREIDRAVSRRVTALAEELNPTVPAVLTAHCHVTRANVSSAQDLYGISDFELSLSSVAHRAFPYVALGHIHKGQVLSDDWRSGTFAAYSGSLDRVDFGEEGEDKGFYVADLENGRLMEEPTFVKVAAREFVTVVASAAGDDPTPAVRAAIDGASIADAVVRVRVRGTPDAFRALDLSELRRALLPAYDSAIQAVYEDAAAGPGGRDERFPPDVGEAKALETYVRDHAHLAADADELIRLGRELINTVRSDGEPA